MFLPIIVNLRNLILLRTSVPQFFLISRCVSRRKYVKYLSINISKLKVGVKHSIRRRPAFSPNSHLVEEANRFSFLAPLIWTELHHHMRLQQRLRSYIPLESTCSFFETAMSSLSGNHTMHLFYLLKNGFKNLLFHSMITTRSFENLFYW